MPCCVSDIVMLSFIVLSVIMLGVIMLCRYAACSDAFSARKAAGTVFAIFYFLRNS
jgi:hypothetical protein